MLCVIAFGGSFREIGGFDVATVGTLLLTFVAGCVLLDLTVAAGPAFCSPTLLRGMSAFGFKTTMVFLTCSRSPWGLIDVVWITVGRAVFVVLMFGFFGETPASSTITSGVLSWPFLIRFALLVWIIRVDCLGVEVRGPTLRLRPSADGRCLPVLAVSSLRAAFPSAIFKSDRSRTGPGVDVRFNSKSPNGFGAFFLPPTSFTVSFSFNGVFNVVESLFCRSDLACAFVNCKASTPLSFLAILQK